MTGTACPLPVDRLHGIGLVTDDLDSTLEDYSRFFGVPEWQVWRLASGDGCTFERHGREMSAEILFASGSAANITFDVITPVAGETIFLDFLNRRPAGVHDITTHILDQSQFSAALPSLERNGIGVEQTIRIGDELEIHYLDTEAQLATTTKLLVAPQRDAETLRQRPPERIVRFDRPSSDDRLPIERAYHVCVNTRNRRLSVQEAFQRIFGIEDWFEFDNESGVSVRDVHYHGRPSQARFRLSCGRRGDFSVEVVEMLYGESGYADMLAESGEGIHHIFTTVCTLERLEQAKRSLSEDGYSIVQDGANGPIYYGYFGGNGKLAGLNVEMLCPLAEDWSTVANDAFWQILLGSDFRQHPMIGR